MWVKFGDDQAHVTGVPLVRKYYISITSEILLTPFFSPLKPNRICRFFALTPGSFPIEFTENTLKIVSGKFENNLLLLDNNKSCCCGSIFDF